MSEYSELAKYLTRSEPKMTGAYLRPRDAASLILVDRSGKTPKLLFGKRHEGHVFMPGVFVFPGGRLDPEDSRMKFAGKLDAVSARRLRKGSPKTSAARINALALAAIRETSEETGILLGSRAKKIFAAPSEGWKPFAEAGLHPDLSALTFFARAITPPGRPRRFDTRFFLADRRDAHIEHPDIAGPDSEFVELKWLTCEQALNEKIPAITKVIVEEAATRMKSKSPTALPASFFFYRNGRFHREELA
jgi:8-oxo-dGTP pyrophosphatase MutT (NUDIX family)